ncbi:hypothetical protein LUZ60_001139 [Juncus effusus]|nr:hypothetical protein LUZ60_001139 [Juncus effusus]
MFSVETKKVPGGSWNANKFPSLEILNIWEMYDLGELFVIRDGDYPCLHTLSISKCPMLITIPELPSLLELSIHYCTKLSKIPKLPLLRSLKLEGLQKIISLELHNNLIMLNKLEISHCSELLSLDGLSLLTYIEELRLIECPKVNLPDGWQAHSFRKYLYTRVYGNKEVDAYTPDVSIAKELALLLKVDQETILETEHEINNKEEVVKKEILEYKAIDDISEEHSLKLEMAEKVILALKWNSSPLFESPEESSQYLSAIDDLLSLSFDLTFPYSYWDRVDSNLQLAMLCLVDEFCHLASPAPGSLSSYLHHLPDRTCLESPDTVLDFPLFTPLPLDLFSTYIIPKDSMQYLKQIAERMIRARHEPELCKAYVDSRRKALADCLVIMGVGNLSTEEVQRIDWPILDQKIKKCIRAMKMIHGVLHEEKSACETIFCSSESIKEECFTEVAKGSVLQLLNFGTAVAVRKRTPEKLFWIVAMYESLIELIPHLEALFSGKTRVLVIKEAKGTLACLGDAVNGTTISDFGNLIRGETLKKPLKYGDTDPLTRYVMEYICLFVDYSGARNNLLAREDDQSGLNYGIGTSAAERALNLITYLENNLEEKKKLYDDEALQHIFMTNNLLYIMQRVRGSVLKVLLGGNWLRKLRHRIRQYLRGYSRSTELMLYLS